MKGMGGMFWPFGKCRSSSVGSVQAIWEKCLRHTARPKLRMQSPRVVFATSASLRSSEQMNKTFEDDEYMPSLVPSGINLLESFKDDPALQDALPRLSALRVSRVVPNTQVARDLLRPMRNVSQRSFAAVPAVSSRVRYSRLNTNNGKAALIASLDFDVTPFADCEVVLEKLEINMAGGTIEPLTGGMGMKLPITCRPRDDLTFLYRLIPDSNASPSTVQRSNARILDVSIVATALVSDTCRPQITMRWRTSADFVGSRNSANYGGSVRPSALPMTPSGIMPNTSLSLDGRPLTMSSDFGDDLGSLTVTFSGPEEVRVGEPFQWSAFVVNRSTRNRKLALVVPPRRRKEIRKTHLRGKSSGGTPRDDTLAEPVVDENFNYALCRSHVLEPADLVCLSTDIRIG
jgi:TRAPP trafficking subunit Trs65